MPKATDTDLRTDTVRRIVWPFPPGVECYAAWKAAISRMLDCAIPPDTDPALFDFHGHTWQLPEAFVQVNGGSAVSMVRSPSVIADRPISQMSLYLLTSGSVVAEYDGRERTHSPGDIVAVDYSLPYESHTPGYEGMTITFDRAFAPAGLQDHSHGMVLSADSGAGRFLGAQIRSLVDHIEGLSVDQAQSAVDGILRFAATTLPAATPRRKQAAASVVDRAQRLARRRLSDPDFGPEQLAIAMGVSRSKLFRSFEPHGGVQRWLLGERLMASLQSAVRSMGNLKVAALARQHGFRSEAHFSRAFRKRYQVSPSSALDLIARSQGSTLYLSWAKKNAKAEASTPEAWLAAALAQEHERAARDCRASL
jgi:AraC-like DNA-binding protein